MTDPGLAGRAIALRRRLHAHPEVGWTEYFATAAVREELLGLGIDDLVLGRALYRGVERMGPPDEEADTAACEAALAAGVPAELMELMAGGLTGLVATIDSGLPGPEVAIRADIDALPIRESDDPSRAPVREGFASGRAGISHACGHDSHTATLVLVAALLRREGLPRRGRVRLIFQPAEEGTRGAQALVDAGWLDEADSFLSLHNASRDWFTAGDVSVGVHDMLATVKVDVHLAGREAHAALSPELGRSALNAAAAIAMLTPALPRRKDLQTVSAVGELHAGTSRNVVPGSAVLRAEFRSTDNAELDGLVDRFRRLVDGIGSALEIETRVEVVGRAPAADSDASLMDVVRQAVAETPGARAQPSMEFGASDDASAMMRAVQRRGGAASYLHIGNDFPGLTHTPMFDVVESTIPLAAEVLARAVARLVGDAADDTAAPR